jgi:DNA-binding NarL/FixJ family response regulator
MADRQLIEVYRRRISEKLSARYAAVFDSLLEGAKRRDVAEEHGLTAGQVTAMIARIRAVVA